MMISQWFLTFLEGKTSFDKIYDALSEKKFSKIFFKEFQANQKNVLHKRCLKILYGCIWVSVAPKDKNPSPRNPSQYRLKVNY